MENNTQEAGNNIINHIEEKNEQKAISNPSQTPKKLG